MFKDNDKPSQNPPANNPEDKPIIAQGPQIFTESAEPPLNDKPIIIQKSFTHLDSEDESEIK